MDGTWVAAGAAVLSFIGMIVNVMGVGLKLTS